MGIQKLNTFIKRMCPNCIYNNIPLKQFKSSTIAIDISMLLYNFKKKGSLLDKIEQFHLHLIKYNINPIYVFDGKPPEKKMILMNKRKQMKIQMYKKQKILQEQLNDNNNNNNDNDNILKTLEFYKSQCIFISKDEIRDVKHILDKYTAKWIQCIEEADTVLSYLSKNGIVEYVLSDDTDMFAFGCLFVLRELDFENRTVSLYHTKKIYNTLHITEETFRMLCCISNNDYNSMFNNYFEMNYNRYISKQPLRKVKEQYFKMISNIPVIRHYLHNPTSLQSEGSYVFAN